MSKVEQMLEMDFGIEGLDTVSNDIGGFEIPEGYVENTLNDFYEDDIIQGKPHLTDIIEYSFTDEDDNEVNKARIELIIVDDDEEEFTRVRINLKTNDNIQKNVHFMSSLFKLIKGLAEMKKAGCFGGYNIIKKVDLAKIKEQVNALDEITLKVTEESIRDNEYNSFVIVNGDSYE